MGVRKIMIIIALFLLGIASTAGMHELNRRQTREIESAVKISSGMTVGGFLSRKDGDRPRNLFPASQKNVRSCCWMI